MKNTIVLCISVMIFQINTFAQWLESNGGMGYQSVGALLADSDTLYAGTTFGVFKSTNEGDNWSSSSNGLTPVTNFYALVRSGNFLVAGGDSPGIWQSSDNGANWVRITSGVDSDEYVQSLYVDGNTVYASIGYTSAIGISTNNGTTWIKSTNGIATSQIMTGVAKLGNILFATHSTLGLYVSTDNGTSWTKPLAGIGAQDKNAIVSSGSNLCVGTTNGVWLSTDSGTTWTHPLTSDFISGLTSKGSEVFAVGQLPYKSTDHGITWNPVDPDGLPGSIWNTMQFTSNYAFVNYYGVGVYRRPISDVTGIDEIQTTALIKEFRLEQNYPNPFNPSTKIKYTIPAVGTSLMKFVQLKVYDILGNEVATVVDEYKPAGSYVVEFESSNSSLQLASGVYFYKLQVYPATSGAGSFVETKKMILLR